MNTSVLQLRRIAIALGVSTAMVVAIAALLPRAFLVNDDPGFVLYLRDGMYAPWSSTVLSWGLVSLYRLSPEVPWYGIYLYAVTVATGAVLIHTCLELIDSRPGFGRLATVIGAIMLGASHVLLAIGITWTTVTISAIGTALVAFIAHLHTCQAKGTAVSPARATIYGLLFVAGFVLRPLGLGATVAALLPLLAWVSIGFVRSRYLPRRAALIAFVAPMALVVAAQGFITQSESAKYEEFNRQRGRLSGAAAFANLETRGPDVLERAGWTRDEYRDFSNWLLTDDSEFSLEKVRRLADTGGVPTPFSFSESYEVLRDIATDSTASVLLFLTAVAGALLLAWLGVVDRRRVVWFSLGYVAFVIVVPMAMSAVSRFPQRLSLSFYTVAAFAMFAFLAGEIGRAPPRGDTQRRGDIAVLVVSLLVLAWARSLFSWVDRDVPSDHGALRQLAHRIDARHGIVMVAAGIVEMDPLLADPRGYDALPSGWGTFTAPWYEYIERFGIHSGNELLHDMVDNPNAYLVAQPYERAMFEEWLRRRLHDRSIRLALVDFAAGMPTAARAELYRVVTTTLTRDSEEWKVLLHDEALANEQLPGPPDVSDRAFRSIPLSNRSGLPFRDEPPATIVEPVASVLRCTTEPTAVEPCAGVGVGSEHAGIYIPVHGLAAARFDITLIATENIVALDVASGTELNHSIHWRWQLDPAARHLGFSGTITLVPGYPAHQLELVHDTARPEDLRDLRVWVEVEPGTHAGFELHRLEVAEP